MNQATVPWSGKHSRCQQAPFIPLLVSKAWLCAHCAGSDWCCSCAHHPLSRKEPPAESKVPWAAASPVLPSLLSAAFSVLSILHLPACCAPGAMQQFAEVCGRPHHPGQCECTPFAEQDHPGMRFPGLPFPEAIITRPWVGGEPAFTPTLLSGTLDVHSG